MLISFRIDWFDLLAVQRTLKSLLQRHNLKASIIQFSTFFMVQLSRLYITTGETIALTIWTFVGKVMSLLFNMLSSVQFSLVTQSRPTLCNPMNRSTPGLPVHYQLPVFTQTHIHRVGDAIQPSHPVVPFSSCPQSFPASGSLQIESALRIRWPKYWSFSFNISPSKEHPRPISFRMDWLDLLAVQGTLKSLIQHHSTKGSILQRSAFFTDQLSHPYMTTGKTIALTRWTFVGKVMSLLFNMLSRLVITFLPRVSVFQFHGCNHHLQ